MQSQGDARKHEYFLDNHTQHTMWAKLPPDLLTEIITQTTDSETLDNWCEATRGRSQYLHETALKAKWRTVTIDDRDLLPAPGDDEDLFHRTQRRLRKHNLGQRWKPAGEMIKMLLNTANSKSDRCLAYYVQNLVFDFRLLNYWGRDFQGAEIDAHKLMPTLETLKHTLNKLNDHFYNLCSVSCCGDTPQPVLDFIASQNAAKVRNLKIRSLGAYGGFQTKDKDEPPRRTYPLRRWPLKLELLSKLHQLQSLDVHCLSNRETAGLLTTLPSLIELRYLILACEAGEHDDDVGGCALKSLLDQVSQNHDTLSNEESPDAKYSGWLPPNLQSLSLVDTNQSSHLVELPYTLPLIMNNHLSHIDVDAGNIDWIPEFFNCFPESPLQSLSIPGCSLDSNISVSRGHAYVDDLIIKHEGSLDKVRLLRAWQTDRHWIEELSDRWQGLYAIQELVLGTRNPEWYAGFAGQWLGTFPKPTLSQYLYGFRWDAVTRNGRWGEEIKRIRIDHIQLSDLEVSVISEPFYARLKILMLQPGPRGTCNKSLPGYEITDKAVCIELAKRIVACGPSSLRVLVISTYWYWISKSTAANEHDGLLWTWTDAIGDPTQNELISTTLDKIDFDFLDRSTVPFWHERDLKEWHRNDSKHTEPNAPSAEMLNQWNYLTMLPLHKT